MKLVHWPLMRWAVTVGTAGRGLGETAARPGPSSRQKRADNCAPTKTRIIRGLFTRTGGGLEHLLVTGLVFSHFYQTNHCWCAKTPHLLGDKKFSSMQLSLISPPVNDVIKRHWSYWNQQKQLPNGTSTGYAWCPLWAIIADSRQKSRETSLPYDTCSATTCWQRNGLGRVYAAWVFVFAI